MSMICDPDERLEVSSEGDLRSDYLGECAEEDVDVPETMSSQIAEQAIRLSQDIKTFLMEGGWTKNSKRVMALRIPPSSKLVLITLIDFVSNSEHHRGIFPSIGTLSRRTGLSKSTVHTAISDLERRSYIAVSRVGKVNQYVLMPTPYTKNAGPKRSPSLKKTASKSSFSDPRAERSRSAERSDGRTTPFGRANIIRTYRNENEEKRLPEGITTGGKPPRPPSRNAEFFLAVEREQGEGQKTREPEAGNFRNVETVFSRVTQCANSGPVVFQEIRFDQGARISEAVFGGRVRGRPVSQGLGREVPAGTIAPSRTRSQDTNGLARGSIFHGTDEGLPMDDENNGSNGLPGRFLTKEFLTRGRRKTKKPKSGGLGRGGFSGSSEEEGSSGQEVGSSVKGSGGGPSWEDWVNSRTPRPRSADEARSSSGTSSRASRSGNGFPRPKKFSEAKTLIEFWQSTLRANGIKSDEDFSDFHLLNKIQEMTSHLGLDMTRRICELVVTNWAGVTAALEGKNFRDTPNLFEIVPQWRYMKIADWVTKGVPEPKQNLVRDGETEQRLCTTRRNTSRAFFIKRGF